MQKFRFRYMFRNGQAGSGIILAASFEAVEMFVRNRFRFSDDVRIYDVEEVVDESQNSVR